MTPSVAIRYLACLLIVLTSGYAQAIDYGAKPNVLFIAVDDLNDWVGHLGGHPQAKTPNIDKLASQSTTFLNAYCPAPACGPSRTALMYGIAPHKSGSYGHHNVYDPANLLRKEQLPLNQVFQNNGYYTAGCGKIFHYREKRGWHQFEGNLGERNTEITKRHGNLSFGIQETDNDSETGDGKLTDWAIDQLEREHEKPFFIALGLKKPHLPWVAPRKYYDLYDPETIQVPKVPENDLADLPEAGKLFAKSLVGFFSPNDHELATREPGMWQELVHAYLATSSFADANVGRILNSLENSPHAENTIVVLWGDHGWHLGEKEHWRKMTLWERGTKTPFIIKLPNSQARQVNEPVSLQDIFPTLVALCKLETSQRIDGNNLTPLLTGSSQQWDKPVLISHGPGNFAVRQGKWRLIHYADGSEELYDLDNDPGEFDNLAIHPKYRNQCEGLRAHLPESWPYLLGPRFKKFADAFARPEQED